MDMDRAAPDPLQVIRARIDAIDEAMHRLLIDRSAVIAELIQVKGTQRSGSAFRPEREAEMMRRIAARHEGILPLATVEHIWREIISTFTALQAPYSVVTAPSADAAALRDCVRFYFGFSVPVEQAESCGAAIERVAEAGSALAVIDAASAERWWRPLESEAAPKILAKLPFIEAPGHPVPLPAYVVGPPVENPRLPDIRVLALSDRPGISAAIAELGGHVAARHCDDIVVELPIAVTDEDLARESGAKTDDLRYLGGFAQPIRILATVPT